jgi:hypothetical protein
LNNYSRFHSFIFICEFKIHLSHSLSFTLSLCPPSSYCYLPWKRTVLTPVLHFFKVYIDSSVYIVVYIDSLGILDLYILYFNQINPHKYMLFITILT